MVDYFPDDLLIKILLRLPLICFIRFRCICKCWSALLSHPKFIYKKLLFDGDDATQNPCPPVLVKRSDRYCGLDVIFSLLSCDSFEMSEPQEVPYPKDIIKLVSDVSIVGSYCNGLVCLRDVYDPDTVFHVVDFERRCNLVLWNPLTSEIKVIPESDASTPPTYSFTTLYSVDFGLDKKTNDCKVLKISKVRYRNPDGTKKPVDFVEIYSVRNAYWRRIDVVVPSLYNYYGHPTQNHTGANGEFHWVAPYDVVCGKQIVSFDLRDETFRTAPMPDVMGRYYAFNVTFTFNDSVALLVTVNNDVEWIDMWVMFEYGVKESWIKLFTISSALYDVEKPLGFSRNGHLLLATWEGRLLLWDPTTELIRQFQTEGWPETWHAISL